MKVQDKKIFSVQSASNRLGELDVFRGVAVILVVLFHCAMFREQSKFGFFLGIAGVDLFFIISGFVILMSAEKKSADTFILSRAIRLYPTYWIAATFTFATRFILDYYDSQLTFTRIPADRYLANLTMFQYYLGVPNIDGSYWTLIIELLFYLFIYVLLGFRILKKIVTVGSFVCLLIFIVFGLIQLGLIPDYTSIFPLLYHFPLFFVGVLFYKIHQNSKLALKYLPLIVLTTFLQLYLHNYGRATLFMPFWIYALLMCFFCILFALFISGKLTFIVTRNSVFFGDISYALYVIHQPLAYGVIVPYFVDVIGVSFWVTTFFIALPTCVLIATLITFYLEKPIHKFLRKKLF